MIFTSGLETAIFKPQRMLGPIAAQVTIEEQHMDELVITEHPVEQGAAITDHAYKRPAEVIIRCGWSNAGAQSLITDLANALDFFDSGEIGSFNYVQEVYEQLLALQESRVRFDIVTGKRRYTDMLFRSLATMSNEQTEHSLILTAVCKQVIIVSTQVVQLPSADVMQYPQVTGPVQNLGTKQAIPNTSFKDAGTVTQSVA